MATAQAVLAAREGGEHHPGEETTRLVTLEIVSPQMPSPLYIVQNSIKQFVAEGKTYIGYYFKEQVPDVKPSIKPEMTFAFQQLAVEQVEALQEASTVKPAPTVTRCTWEVTKGGQITRTSRLLFPMPLHHHVITDSGIEVVCADEDIDNIPLNPVVYTTEDHSGLKAYI